MPGRHVILRGPFAGLLPAPRLQRCNHLVQPKLLYMNNETDIALQETAEERAAPSYWLTRFMILRLLGAIYAVAFLVAINQVLPLIGSHGLTPVSLYIKNIN